MARLIDADALIKRLNKRREDFAGGWKTLDAMPTNAQIQHHENLECALIVEDAPTVDAVEVVHGRWEKAEYCGYARCDQCKDVYIDESWLDDGRWHYCPNCGAKMDGDGNE